MSERALWAELSGSKLGAAFCRQVVIPPSIVDFVAPKAKLIVEVDGGCHQFEVRLDVRREAALQRRGYRVLRLSEELVLRDRVEAVRRVREAFQAHLTRFTVFARRPPLPITASPRRPQSRSGGSADLALLLQDLRKPPIESVGALTVDEFLPKAERKALAAALNGLLASPTFASWREGTTLDVGEWLTPSGGRTPAVIVSVAHLDDTERALVLGVLLEELLSWVRTLPGSSRLRALVVFDEVYGFLPPHPANPPTKRPMVALMKQARAFGVGMLVATQNPMDLDYRAPG